MYLNLIIIALLIILLLQIRYIIKRKNLSDKFIENKNTMCIYMYTFGKTHTKYNFKTKINKKFPNIDFYIYTDDLDKVNFLNNYNYKNNFKSLNIIKVPVLNKLDFIDENRLTAKYYKFKIIPDEIKKYDYMFHIDFGRFNILNHINEKHMFSLIESNKRKKLFLFKFNNLKNDIKHQINNKNESDINLNKFISKINLNKILTKKHVQLSHFIRDLKDSETNFIFEKIYDELILNKLKRDQFIFNYTLIKYNYNYNKIKYVYSFIYLYLFGLMI